MIHYLLAGSFFLAFIAAILKTVRYVIDYRRFRKSFYLVGIPANLALALALALVIVESGDDPLWGIVNAATALQLLIAAWAVLSFVYEFCYARTYLVVDGH